MKIVIVGGGTAGWLAALMIKKIQGNSHDVTVIESSSIGIIGAGEGSTGFLTDIIQGNSWDYGCNEKDFLRETKATIKLGIKHKEWKELGHEYIAPIDGSAIQSVGTDYLFLHSIINDYPVHTSSDNGKFIEDSLSSFIVNGKDIENTKSHAYHFDGHLVGKYFKKVCGDSVNVIDARVNEISIGENGFIESLILDNGSIISADFFIDASGLSKLFSKKLNIDFISYKENLPVNTAMPFLLPYEEDEKIDPVTTAWAQKYGWMWMIPKQDGYGCGYVYDDSFITREEAQKEIEEKLGRKIEPIKFIQFEAGRLDKLWDKNCLFIGLAGAFAEPLEATSIHSTILQLNAFIFNYLRDSKEETCNQGNINIYNKRMTKMYDDFKDFLSIHYMSQRNDSEFWKMMGSGERLTEQAKNILEMQKSKLLHPNDLDAYFGYAGAQLYNWVLYGLGFITKDLAEKELKFFSQNELASTIWELNQKSFENIKNDIIDNTSFIKNMEGFLDGYSFS